MTRLTLVFLVVLRLAIGWHFLFEGAEKLKKPGWSSAAYLRGATGPLADHFHKLAGDPVLDVVHLAPLQPGDDIAQRQLPPALEREWQIYFAAFNDHYPELSDDQRKQAASRFAARQKETVRWLLGLDTLVRSDTSDKTAIAQAWKGADQTKNNTPKRVADYQAKLATINQVENGELKDFGPGVNKKLQTLKADVDKLRAELQGDINEQTARMRESLHDVLTKDQKDQEAAAIKEQKRAAMPVKPAAGWKSWQLMDWLDLLVKFGLTAVGVCLIVGLFTRTACVGGALLLLSFYLAMPALPWLPANPRAEGYYFFVNKNIIEMLALLTLATTCSGRWVGLDGLVHCFFVRRKQKQADKKVSAKAEPAVSTSKPVDSEATIANHDTPMPARPAVDAEATLAIAEPPAEKPTEKAPVPAAESAGLDKTPTDGHSPAGHARVTQISTTKEGSHGD